jgi:hypothetical protein
MAELIPIGSGVLDRAWKRGEFRDVQVGNASMFYVGMRIDIRSKDDIDVIKGTALVDAVDELGNILKLDAIPAGIEPGDFITLGENHG